MAHRPFFLFTRSPAAYGPHNASLTNLLLFGIKDEPAFFLFQVQLQGFAFGVDCGLQHLFGGVAHADVHPNGLVLLNTKRSLGLTGLPE